MMNFHLLDMLDCFLRELMGNHHQCMGGKLIVLMGDFRRILPVVVNGSRADIVSQAVVNSKVWNSFIPLRLTENMRVGRLIHENTSPERRQQLENHAEWLLQVGEGTAPAVNRNLIEVPDQMVCSSPEELKNKAFNNREYLSKRAIMSCTNDVVQDCNYRMIEKLPGDMFVSKSIDECVEENDRALYEADFLNRINPSGIAPHRLALKENAIIILIRNLDIKRGHCNGTRYIIRRVSHHLIVAEKLHGGPYSTILIPRIPMISKDTDFPAIFKRLQFPVLGAYYLTINRAQGQSFDTAGFYLP